MSPTFFAMKTTPNDISIEGSHVKEIKEQCKCPSPGTSLLNTVFMDKGDKQFKFFKQCSKGIGKRL